MKKEEFDQIEEVVKTAARVAAGQWKGVMEYDDIHQELWLYILESPSVKRVVLKDLEEGVRRLTSKAYRICNQERIDYEHFKGNFQYTPGDVREILNGQLASIPAEVRADLEVGLDRLCNWFPKKYDLIMRYMTGDLVIPGKNSPERKQLNRAVDKLAEEMNDNHRKKVKEAFEGGGPKVGGRHNNARKAARHTPPSEPKEIQDWDIYKQGVITNG